MKKVTKIEVNKTPELKIIEVGPGMVFCNNELMKPFSSTLPPMPDAVWTASREFSFNLEKGTIPKVWAPIHDTLLEEGFVANTKVFLYEYGAGVVFKTPIFYFHAEWMQAVALMAYAASSSQWHEVDKDTGYTPEELARREVEALDDALRAMFGPNSTTYLIRKGLKSRYYLEKLLDV